MIAIRALHASRNGRACVVCAPGGLLCAAALVRHATESMARFASWLASQSDADIAYMVGSLLALVILVIAGIILLMRSCNSQTRTLETGPARADEYDMLQVIVVAHDQEAELEVQTDAWNSYEELRELVVDAVPNMFRDTDELTLEYKNEQSRWIRVKMKTPVDAVKAARCARITVPSRGSSRALRR